MQIWKEQSREETVQRMDTVVRLSDRRWFRVIEVNEKEAVLKDAQTGEFGGRPETVTVTLDRLYREFEKKQYPPVRCYTVSELEEREKNKPKPAPAEPKKPEASQEEPALQPAARPEDETADGGYVVEREYIAQVDRILTVADIAKSPEETAIRTKQLIAQILNEGIRKERSRLKGDVMEI